MIDALGFQRAIIAMGSPDLRRCDSVAADESDRNATAKVVREAGLASGAVPPEPHFADATRRDFDARA